MALGSSGRQGGAGGALGRGVEGAGGGLAVFSVILIVEKLTTVYETNHFVNEYIPLDKKVTPM